MTKPTLHLICNAHLDPVWQWRWEEGCAEALSTFGTAVDLLAEHPSLIFNHNESVLYRWVEHHDPQLFAEIRRWVAAGRWSIAGGWYLQPDANLPGLEAFVRHIAEGRQYFWQRFGVRPRVAYNFDSFGHHGGLPQLLRLAGYEMYVHMRPDVNDLTLPSDVYRWQGVDGSEILALRIAVGLYHTERDNIGQRLAEGRALALRLGRDVPVFWGLGNHGGGATREDLRIIDDFMRSQTDVQVVHSTLEQVLDSLQPWAATAPLVQGDLQRVFTGCYTSLSRIKRRARTSLAGLVQCEALCTAAWWQGQQAYPAATLDSLWRDHLFNDFHDILPGTCTEPAEQDALDAYGRVSHTLRQLRLAAVTDLFVGEPQQCDLPVLVAHTNLALDNVPIEIEFMVDHRPLWTGLWHTRLYAAGGEEIPAQEEQPAARLPFNDWRRKLVAMVEPPALGLQPLEIKRFAGLQESNPAVPTLRHQFDERLGLVNELYTSAGAQCLTGPLLAPLVVSDEGDSWGTGYWEYNEVTGHFELEQPPRLLFAGPIRTVWESQFAFRSSRLMLQTIAYSQWPVLEFRFLVHWNEPRQRLKLQVPTIFRDTLPQCEIPGGMIERPNDGGHHVHGRWLMMCGETAQGPGAVGIVNSGQHGIDCQNGNVQLSVLRSAGYCHERGQPLDRGPAFRFMDLGEHEFRLLITAGSPDEVLQRLSGLADWLDAPPVVYAHLRPRRAGKRTESEGPANAGSLSTIQPLRDFVSVEPATVRLVACKKAFAAEALVLRLHETIGRSCSARIKVAGLSDKIEVSFRPFELRTLRVERNGQVSAVNLIDEV